MDNQYTPQDVSVIICAFTLARWNDLVEAVDSVRQQAAPPREVIVVIDHNPQMLQQVRDQIPGVIALENRGEQGASSSRNSGALVATGSLIAFLDDDAIACPGWVEHLCEGYTTDQIIGVGGFIEPLWSGVRPRWFPNEFDWAVGGTYEGMPKTTAPVRNIWSGNLSIRSEVFKAINGFRTGFGKVGSRSNPEDTDLCIRALQQWPGGMWLYKPDAKILHKVPVSRTSVRYFLRRCYYEGTGKADLANLVGNKDGTTTERSYVLQTLPKGVLRGLTDTIFRGDVGGVMRATAIVVGLAFTTVGYIVGAIGVFNSKKASAIPSEQ